MHFTLAVSTLALVPGASNTSIYVLHWWGCTSAQLSSSYNGL